MADHDILAEQFAEQIEELTEQIEDVNQKIEAFEEQQEAVLKAYDGLPDTVTVLGEERDIASVLRDKTHSGRIKDMVEDSPKALKAIDKFLEIEVDRDQLSLDRDVLERQLQSLPSPVPTPGFFRVN